MDLAGSIRQEIFELQMQNTVLANGSKRISRSAFKTLDTLEAFTENCIRLTRLNTELRRVIALQAMQAREARDIKKAQDLEHDRMFSELCDAVEPKWPVGQMFIL